AQPAAHRQRQVHGLGGAAHDVEHRGTPFVRRGDVQEDELVRALPVVGDRGLDGVTSVGTVEEAHALDAPSILHVEARDHPAGQHRRHAATAAIAAPRSTAPVYRARPTMAPATLGMTARRTRSSTPPTPPDAITGTGASAASAAVASRFGPPPVPSR